MTMHTNRIAQCLDLLIDINAKLDEITRQLKHQLAPNKPSVSVELDEMLAEGDCFGQDIRPRQHGD